MDDKRTNNSPRLSATFHSGGNQNRSLPNIEDPDRETEESPKDSLEELGELWIWPPPLL